MCACVFTVFHPVPVPAVQLEGGRAQERAAGRGDAAERPGDGTAGNVVH